MDQQPELKWENMLAGIRAQAPFLEKAPRNIYEQLDKALDRFPIPEQIYLTGCGDSWFCGLASKYAFLDWTGIPTDAPPALEFSRYLASTAPQNSLLVAVSTSGLVSRTLEAVQRAKHAGIASFACTGNLSEGISQYADAAIDLGYPERRFAPGTNSYLASLVVQYCLALNLARRRGRFSKQDVERWLDAISTLDRSVSQTIAQNHHVLKNLAEGASLEANYVFVGGGPNLGTAYFSAAKLVEAAQVNACGQELEEWAHITFFNAREGTWTFLLAPPGQSQDRGREILAAILGTPSTSVVICPAGERATFSQADFVFPIFGETHELLTPLLYSLPAQLFSCLLGKAKGLEMFGFDDENIKRVNFRTIYESKIST